MMGVVEEEIAKAKKRWPEKAELLNEAFMMFANIEEKRPFYELMSLFPYHVREILERVVNRPSRKELRNLGTNAQAIAAFYYVTMKTPVTDDAGMAYYTLMRDTVGDDMEMLQHAGFERVHESYPGAIQELITEAKKKTSVDRVYPEWKQESML